ncbi:MAG: MurT ligase domain-containing protein [Firmicutes bacterium]|nr:MurT ligase domain-containing protein [Bacillota bacterium]
MGKLRFYTAMAAGKLSGAVLRLMKKSTCYVPGHIAVSVWNDFLSGIQPPKTVIAVTGTNGKTTVDNLITTILQENGYSVTSNRLGPNMRTGIASAFLENCTFSGRCTTDVAVLEVDEGSTPVVFPTMKPDYLICTNLMRDSIKHNGHPWYIAYLIGLATPETTKMILNADDMICSSVRKKGQDVTYFGIDAARPTDYVSSTVCDVVYCPECGEKLEVEYLRYNHIGRMHCPKCGGGSPAPDFLVTDINPTENSFTVLHDGIRENYRLINDNLVNVYNFVGVIALLSRMGLSFEQIAKGFAKTEIVSSRYNVLQLPDRKIVMQMAKGQNAMACGRSYDYVSHLPGKRKGLILLVDDKFDNVKDTESTCWLYDCDFSYLADDSISQIVFAGPRCRDQYLRALIAGVDEKKLRMVDIPKDGAKPFDISLSDDIYILYDVYYVEESYAVRQELMDRMKGEEK